MRIGQGSLSLVGAILLTWEVKRLFSFISLYFFFAPPVLPRLDMIGTQRPYQRR